MIESIYSIVCMFVTFYPIVASIMWVTFSITYRIRWEDHHHEKFPKHKPKVSVLVPAYNEEQLIVNALNAMCNLDYPDFEIIVINDGSTDRTAEKVVPFLFNTKVRLINKKVNQGKSLALNDAFAVANGEIIVVLDADASPEPDLLHHLTWHFQHARVAAVTGHPRVRNVGNLLTRIQIIEFTSIIGMMRRSQRIWGRIVTVSGIVAAYRKTAIASIGGFRPDMYTEDIDITWRLERKHWDIRYEPRAIVWMYVPDTMKSFLKQRLRWSKGLMQVLRMHRDIVKHWSQRRLWTVFGESVISLTWNALYGLVLLIEGTKVIMSFFSDPATPVNTIFSTSQHEFVFNVHWLMIMASFSMLQLITGGLLEMKHDKDILKFFPYAVLYPAFYWVFMVMTELISIPVLWEKITDKVEWSTKRT